VAAAAEAELGEQTLATLRTNNSVAKKKKGSVVISAADAAHQDSLPDF
jgi:hypothetical protein